MRTKTVTVSILLYLLISCDTNSIHFNIKEQAVVSDQGKITNLYITNMDNDDFFRISIIPGKKASRVFRINKLNNNYKIETLQTYIAWQDFKLSPNTEYEITNISNGDAAGGELMIKTDRNSNVIYSNR